MAHVHADPTATGILALPDEWLPLSARLTGALPALTDRYEDLVVHCAPGAGHGSPACYLPHLGVIEVDAAHLDGLDPTGLDPMIAADRDRYPVVWGLVAHEASHADHTRWQPPDGTPAPVTEAALVLEEARIEAAHLARRPADRRWLRDMVTQVVLADFPPPATTPPPAAPAAPGPDPAAPATPGPDPAAPATPGPDPAAPPAPAATRPGGPAAAPRRGVGVAAADAARAATLLLARVDAGVLDADETDRVRAVVAGILGARKYARLRAVWRKALRTGDEDGDAMAALGRRWCEIAGINPDQAPTTPGDADTTPAGEPAPPGGPSPLAQAVADALDAVRDTNRRDRAQEKRAQEKKTREDTRRNAEKASNVSDRHKFPDGYTNLGRRRAPTGSEQAAARRLARALRDAARRESTTRTVTSATPPGRLRMRVALAAAAQRAAGAVPTAEPFTRTQRRATPTPPLRVGIACDVSMSMKDAAGPVASAAWILARATSHLPDATSATVIFGNRVRPITRPGRVPTQVIDWTANDYTEAFVTAVDTLDTTLGLSGRDGARLLVVISDGHFNAIPDDYQQVAGRARLDRIAAAGCAVLWLTPHNAVWPWLAGVTAYQLTDPATTADAIGRAAIDALRHA
ncbi:VWA domain-containing protein [Frankia sp. AgW1.1]|uniref:VWA domain-containing protein n=1 Tax=Frankia sp. AgW1.1 TaxID=1836971 RepID=UPI0019329F0A|nr:VWA domain-containing protein [Frankia sp. AgW1.1]MBL7491176.1 VWA domain-containing protein [Frankia sp. AgW1.1]